VIKETDLLSNVIVSVSDYIGELR